MARLTGLQLLRKGWSLPLWVIPTGLAATVWIVLGLAKMWSPTDLQKYLQVAVGLSASNAWFVAYAIAAIEISTGLYLFAAPLARRPWRPLLLSLGLSALLVVAILLEGPMPVCGCFGRLVSAAHGSRLVAASVLLFLSATAGRLLGAEGKRP